MPLSRLDMGCTVGISNCSADEPATGNPNPSKFKILRIANFTDYTLTEILYPDCKNFEGKKILLFRAPNAAIEKAVTLDPHFCEGNHLSPIARFRPDSEGWLNGVKLALMLLEDD